MNARHFSNDAFLPKEAASNQFGVGEFKTEANNSRWTANVRWLCGHEDPNPVTRSASQGPQFLPFVKLDRTTSRDAIALVMVGGQRPEFYICLVWSEARAVAEIGRLSPM